MNAVLYTCQLEPITVVDIPMWLWDNLKRGDTIRLVVVEEPSYVPIYTRPVLESMRIVSIFGERFVYKNQESLMLFTHDEESALLLKAGFLPGQYAEVQRHERSAFAEGFLKALYHYKP